MKAIQRPVNVVDYTMYTGIKRPIMEWVEELGDTFETHFKNYPMGTLQLRTMGILVDLVPYDYIVRENGFYFVYKSEAFHEKYAYNQPTETKPINFI